MKFIRKQAISVIVGAGTKPLIGALAKYRGFVNA
jgi:hypothetical protein